MEEAGLQTTIGNHLWQIHMVIAGAVGTMLTRNTTVLHAARKKMGAKRQQQEHIALNIPSLISNNNQHTAFIDSGASRHYIREDAPVTISKTQDPGISVGQPG
eukprot:6406128-Ditylum_brightwellii.AAC.1